MSKEIMKTEGEEIDLIKLLLVVWKERKTIIKSVIIFGLLGLFVAIFSAKQYKASTIVVPQVTSNKIKGGLGGLAAMAGINIDEGNSDRIPPSLYPKVVASIPFQKELLEVPLKFSDLDKEVTYKEYYTEYPKFNLLSAIKEYTIGLPSKIIGLFKEKTNITDGVKTQGSFHVISLEDKKLFNLLQSQLEIDLNTKEGFVQISFSMPEALPAAQMTKKAQDLLQIAITKFKVQKAQEQYDFIQDRYNEVKKDFLAKQSKLANFRDKNKGLVLSRSQTRLQRLQSDYDLAYGLFSELAKKLETQKIKLKEDTPVFTVIEPVSVPVLKSKPRRVFIVIIWLFLGVFLGVALVFFRIWLKYFKEKAMKYGS